MDQDSRSSESRERALSSEPSSTRPNPFYDDEDDLSARKRRRTSPSSASRSRSIDTVKSQDDPPVTSVGASDSNMKIDSPEPESEPVLPSTPARAEQPAEPVSSRVTLNLRNADSLEATPASPTSPIPAQFRSENVKVSVEEPEVDMAQAMTTDGSAPLESGQTSPEVPVISIEDDDDEIETTRNQQEVVQQFDGRRAAQLAAHLADFPYRGPAEATPDTLRRLVHYFQHGQPALFSTSLNLANP